VILHWNYTNGHLQGAISLLKLLFLGLTLDCSRANEEAMIEMNVESLPIFAKQSTTTLSPHIGMWRENCSKVSLVEYVFHNYPIHWRQSRYSRR